MFQFSFLWLGFHFSKNVTQLSYIISSLAEADVVTIIATVVSLSQQEPRMRFVAEKQIPCMRDVTSKR